MRPQTNEILPISQRLMQSDTAINCRRALLIPANIQGKLRVSTMWREQERVIYLVVEL